MNEQHRMLILRVLEDQASPAEISRLEQLLAEQPELRAELSVQALDAALIRDALAEWGDSSMRAAPAVEAEPPHPRSWRRPAMAAACVLSVLLLGAWLAFGPGSSAPEPAYEPWTLHVRSALPGARLSRGGQILDLTVGLELRGGDELLSGQQPVTIGVGAQNTHITLGPDSRVDLATQEPELQLNLQSGSVLIDAQTQQPGRSISVRTPTMTMRVVGTRFAVSAGANETVLDVVEGQVRVQPRDDSAGSLLVRQGQRAVADRQGRTTVITFNPLPGLIVNGGFESGDLQGWQQTHHDTGLSLSTEAFAGRFAARMNGFVAKAGIEQLFVTEPGKLYRMQAHVRILRQAGHDWGSFRMLVSDFSTWDTLSETTVTAAELGPNWRPIEATFRAVDTRTRVTLRQFSGDNMQMDVLVDNIGIASGE